MALTDHSDVFASVSEGAFNTVFANIARQRPALFNCGTQSFVTSPQLMCHEIKVASRFPANQPRVALQPLLPVPGTDGAWGLEYCLQLSKLDIDFHPGRIALPPQLKPPLAAQQGAIQLEVCGGIACPGAEVLAKFAEGEAGRARPIDAGRVPVNDEWQPRPKDPPRMRPVPFLRDRIGCFCLDVFATFAVRRSFIGGVPALAIDLTGLEIVDITPERLEASLECLLRSTISLGVLPRIRVVLDDVILSLGQFGLLTVGFTPVSGTVPFNPSIADDQLAVFASLSAS